MSKEIDAVVLVGHAKRILSEAPIDHKDFEQGLWYIRNNKTHWHNKKPITFEDRTNLFAGEIFIVLDQYLIDRFGGRELPEGLPPNPYTDKTLRTIDAVSPFMEGEIFPIPEYIPKLRLMSGEGNPENQLLPDAPENAREEFRLKWQKANEVHTNRGLVTIKGYNAQELIERLKNVDLDQIPPDQITINPAGSTSEMWMLRSWVKRTGLQADFYEIPYYATFSSHNAAEMLQSALEDLTNLSKALQEKL